MHKNTGEIKQYDVIKDKREWSKPFHVGQEVELFGVKMEIKKIKKLRGEIILMHHS